MTISDCQTSDNAAGIYFDKGKYLKLENCERSGCKGEGVILPAVSIFESRKGRFL